MEFDKSPTKNSIQNTDNKSPAKSRSSKSPLKKQEVINVEIQQETLHSSKRLKDEFTLTKNIENQDYQVRLQKIQQYKQKALKKDTQLPQQQVVIKETIITQTPKKETIETPQSIQLSKLR